MKNKQINYISFFSGVGTWEQALINLGYKLNLLNFSEIHTNKINLYCKLYNTDISKNLGDISKITEQDALALKQKYISQGVDKVDLITYSFPCFTGDNLVLTDKGYKYIKDINVGDKVLTHSNTYKKVSKFFNNGIKEVGILKCMGADEIKCTPNHKFYVRKMYRKCNGEQYEKYDAQYKKYFKVHRYKRNFTCPEWIEANQLNSKCYLGMSINNNSVIPSWDGIFLKGPGNKTEVLSNVLTKLMDNKDFWWLIGRYFGDGWIRHNGGMIICCCHNDGDKELNEIKEHLEKLPFKYSIFKERTVYKIHFYLKEISAFLSQFGKGALNKELNNTILDLPVDLLKPFLDGYFSADGNINQYNEFKITTISRKLVYGIGQCIMKVYHTPYKVNKIKVPSTCFIEDRLVHCHDCYEVVFHLPRKQDRAFYENGYVWVPFRYYKTTGKEIVYDIEVEEDHSFTVQNTIVHNCQDCSLAGLKKGLLDENNQVTRSGLFFKTWEIISVLRPKVAIFENVEALLHSNMKNSLHAIIKTIENNNYSLKIIPLSPEKIGIPMRRPRIFGIAIDNAYFNQNVRIRGLGEDALQDALTLQDWLRSDIQPELPEAPGIKDYLNRRSNDLSLIKNNAKVKGLNTKESSFTGKYIAINQAQTILFGNGNRQLVYERARDIVRYYNIEEIAKLFGMPDSYIQIGRENGYSNSQLINYLGDAVSCHVLSYILKKNKHLLS